MKKQSLIKGSLILGLAGMLAKVLGFFFRWPLIMLIGDEGIGYYQLSYPLYMFFVAMASGVPIAVSKMISEKNAIGDVKGSYEVVKESSFLMITLGLGTSLILVFFAKPIISFLKWDMKSYYSLIGISFAPMMVSFVTIFRGFFQGLQNMTPSGISQILEQIGRVVIGVGLAYFLFDKGIDKILKKVGEECAEIIIAAKNPDKEEIKYEISDFLYHAMVLMVEKGVTWEEITSELARR